MEVRGAVTDTDASDDVILGAEHVRDDLLHIPRFRTTARVAAVGEDGGDRAAGNPVVLEILALGDDCSEQLDRPVEQRCAAVVRIVVLGRELLRVADQAVGEEQTVVEHGAHRENAVLLLAVAECIDHEVVSFANRFGVPGDESDRGRVIDELRHENDL